MTDITTSEAIDDATKLYNLLLKVSDAFTNLGEQTELPDEIRALIEEVDTLLDTM